MITADISFGSVETLGERQRPRAIVFDWDNTLIDSWHAILDAQNHTLTSFGLEPWTLEQTRERVRGSMRELVSGFVRFALARGGGGFLPSFHRAAHADAATAARRGDAPRGTAR